VANLDKINTIAESNKGFIWRLKDDTNNATSIKVYDDEFLIVNMSVWANTDALFNFVYQSSHVEILKKRKQWFEQMKEMHMALWWYVPENAMPTVQDAVERLDFLRLNGDTPFSFTFKNKFTVEESIEFSAQGK
jgi:hypothetical protein